MVEDRHLVRIGCTSCLPRTRNLDDRHTGILLFAPAGRNGGVGRRIDDRRSLYPTRRTNRRATRCRWNVALPPLLYLVGSTVLSKTKWQTGPRSERNLCVMFFAHFCETLYGTHLLFHCGEWVGDFVTSAGLFIYAIVRLVLLFVSATISMRVTRPHRGRTRQHAHRCPNRMIPSSRKTAWSTQQARHF